MLASLQQSGTCRCLFPRLPQTNRLLWRHNGYSLPAKHYSSTAPLPKRQVYHGWIDRKKSGSRLGLAPEACSRERRQPHEIDFQKLDNTDPKPTAKNPPPSITADPDILTRKSTPGEASRLRNARGTSENWHDRWDIVREFVKAGITTKKFIREKEQRGSNGELAASSAPFRNKVVYKKNVTTYQKKESLDVVSRLNELLPFLDEHTVSADGPYLIDGQALNQETLRKRIDEIAKLNEGKSRYNQFYKRLLSWRYEDTGDYPPGFEKSEFQKVRDTYADCDAYMRVFEPLLMLETWGQIQQAKSKSQRNPTGQAKFMLYHTQGEFRYISFAVSQKDADLVLENDVVAITEALPSENRLIDGREGGKDRRTSAMLISERFFGRKTFFALVKGLYADSTHVQMTVRVYFDYKQTESMMSKLLPGSCWEFCRLRAITSAQREYAALQSMDYLDENLVKEILRPQKSLRRPELCHTEVQRIMEAHGLNQSQAEAVSSATTLEYGFSLIQGPPGTGKTTTILGLVGELLSASKANVGVGGGEKDNSGPIVKNKLLICAHSSAAVDEIVRRLRNGIRDKSGTAFYPRVVRLGNPGYIGSTSVGVSPEVLAEKALGPLESESAEEAEKGIDDQQSSMLPDSQKAHRMSVSAATSVREMKKAADASIQLLHENLERVNVEIRELYAEKADVDSCDPDAVRIWKYKLQMSKKKRSNIAYEQAHLLIQKGEHIRESGIWTNNSPRYMARKRTLEEADIICSTLAGSGRERAALLDLPLETVIIDEAAQSTESICLIPLRYGCKRCILVGDLNQLPPVVISNRAAQYLYSQSLFERIQKLEPQAVNTLNVQYRMHPEISTFPSRQFYKSCLLDNPDMAVKRRAPWHDDIKYRPFQFFDIYSGREQVAPSHSVYNMAEVTAAVQLVYNLCTDYPDLPWKHRIGVISSYNAQLEKLVEQFQRYFGDSITEAIEFNTVDGFQGQEKDVIIFSCVRAGEVSMGSLKDQRRMNVGLTRARKSLFVLGNANRLIVSPPWKKFIGEAKARWLLRKGSLPLFGNPAKRGEMPKGLLRDADEEGN